MKAKILILTALALTAASCNGSAMNEYERQALQENVDRREADFGPLVGSYEGTLTRPDGSAERISLVLVPMIMIVQNPGRNDVSEVPTLGGMLNLLLNEQGIDDIFPIAQFSTAKYESGPGRLRMSGMVQTSSSIGMVSNSLDATFHGQRITGTAMNSTIGELGFVDVLKTSSN